MVSASRPTAAADSCGDKYSRSALTLELQSGTGENALWADFFYNITTQRLITASRLRYMSCLCDNIARASEGIQILPDQGAVSFSHEKGSGTHMQNRLMTRGTHAKICFGACFRGLNFFFLGIVQRHKADKCCLVCHINVCCSKQSCQGVITFFRTNPLIKINIKILRENLSLFISKDGP